MRILQITTIALVFLLGVMPGAAEQERIVNKEDVDRIFAFNKAQWNSYANQIGYPQNWKIVLNPLDTGTAAIAYDPETGFGISVQPIYNDNTGPPVMLIVGNYYPKGSFPEFSETLRREIERAAHADLGAAYDVSVSFKRTSLSERAFDVVEITVTRARAAERGSGTATVFQVPAREYVDHRYQFAFQFPEDWKIEKNPPPGKAAEVRAIVRHPKKPLRVMAMVSHVGKTFVTKHQFESVPAPSREALVGTFVESTVELVYKNASRNMGAESMLVSEKRTVPSEAGLSFYISTLHFKGKVAILITGIHIVPFEKPYIISFMMFTPVDPTARKDNETITRVFNSFRVLGERPIK